jgi:hypothetical protein
MAIRNLPLNTWIVVEQEPSREHPALISTHDCQRAAEGLSLRRREQYPFAGRLRTTQPNAISTFGGKNAAGQRRRHRGKRASAACSFSMP